MDRNKRRVAAVALAAVTVGACHARRLAVWVATPGGGVELPSRGDGRASVTIVAPAIAALGDTILVEMKHMTCYVDVCTGSQSEPQYAGWHLAADPAESLDRIGENGFVARRVGAVRVVASRKDATLTRAITIVPAVATFEWSPATLRVRAGDTVHACAVARDARGRELGIVRPDYLGGGQGDVEIFAIPTDRDPCRWVTHGGSGQIVLAAALGSRIAKLTVTIDAR